MGKISKLFMVLSVLSFAVPAFAQGEAAVGVNWVAIAAGFSMAFASGICALAQGKATASAAESLARNPAARPGILRVAAPAVRQRPVRLCNCSRIDQSGRADPAAANQQRHHERGRPARARIREGSSRCADTHRRHRQRAVRGAPAAHRQVAAVSRSRRAKLQVFRVVTFVLFGAFFAGPIWFMFEFSTRGIGENSPRTLDAWKAIGTYPDLVAGIVASLELAVITSIGVLVVLVPTMVWVRLRLPRLRRVIESISLLPLTIPAIVLVVGFAPMYQWLGTNFSDSILTLSLAYAILVLPYAYRALDAGLAAIDVKTLSEAARSLGASWPVVMWRVIVPNISSALLNAGLLSVALVLGEFTIANNLLYPNLQVEIVSVARTNAGTSIAVAVASLLFAFVLLVALSFVGGQRGGRRRTRERLVQTFGRDFSGGTR